MRNIDKEKKKIKLEHANNRIIVDATSAETLDMHDIDICCHYYIVTQSTMRA